MFQTNITGLELLNYMYNVLTVLTKIRKLLEGSQWQQLKTKINYEAKYLQTCSQGIGIHVHVCDYCQSLWISLSLFLSLFYSHSPLSLSLYLLYVTPLSSPLSPLCHSPSLSSTSLYLLSLSPLSLSLSTLYCLYPYTPTHTEYIKG